MTGAGGCAGSGRAAPGVEIAARTLATEALDKDRIAALEAVLDAGEQARARRFADAADRRDFVAAHGLVKEMLGSWFGLDPSRVRLRAETAGAKPRLIVPECAGLDVNISHCRGLVACVGGVGCRVGIDAEPLALPSCGEIGASLAAELFSREEIRWLRDGPASGGDAKLLRLWTLKEALAKAEGSGLRLGLGRCAVLSDPPRLLSLPPQMGPVSEWSLRQWTPTPRHIVALAYRAPAGEARSLDIVDLA